MKNKFFFIFILLIKSHIVYAEQFIFETKNIKILNKGKIITSDQGKVVSTSKDLEIIADRFEYNKELNQLDINGNGFIFLKTRDIKIFFDSGIIDQKNSIYKAKGNILFEDLQNKILIEAKEIVYDDYNQILTSDMQTILRNTIENEEQKADKFYYDIKNGLIKYENLELKSKEDINIKSKISYFDVNNREFIGKDFQLSFLQSEYNLDPRLKGNIFKQKTNGDSEITKGIFTTCKKNDNCPPWSLKAKKINHDKKKKIIFYEDTVLRIYNLPVLYFPKFFHPDPSVKRQSGFLMPSLKSSNNVNFFDLPYFYAINKHSDATLTPRLYTNDSILMHTEYRQKNFNSDHVVDSSFYYSRNNKNKNHFFYDFNKNLENSKIDINIQTVSDDTYLKREKINLKDDTNNFNILKNSINYEYYIDDLNFDFETSIYENLEKNSNDRYEYIFPNIKLEKKLENQTKLKGDFSFTSKASIRNYNTNVYDRINVNDLYFNSSPIISESGFYNNFNFLIKNTNSNSSNSKITKNDESLNLNSIIQLNSSLPLIKKNDKANKIITPKISFRLSPGHTQNNKDKDVKIDITNIYELNRIGEDDSIEGGLSMTYGLDYVYNKNNLLDNFFSFKFANNLRISEDEDLPNNNQLGHKTSNFFNEISFKPNEYFKAKYSSSMNNNLKDISYETLGNEFTINNLVTSFEYVNENYGSEKNSFLYNSLEYSFDENNSLIFSTRENKNSDLTEYYNLIYQYQNDCLKASIEYNKDYYSDRDLKPEESLFFKLTIVPFGETSGPNFLK
jgi:LPS-assembly protein